MIKKLFTLLTLGALLLSSCVKQADFDSFKDDFTNLENRVKKLETLCEEMNGNISSLRTIVTALDQADFITGVEEVKEGDVVVAYKISFKNSSPITITLGTAAPEIGVKKDTDDIYYWTLDGEWIKGEGNAKLPVTGEGGMPELKIQEGFWYVSYNGNDWEKLGKATGEDGAPGSAGDSIFKNIVPGDGFVTIVLANDMQITFPLYIPVTIALDQTEVLAYDGDEVEVNYTLSGSGLTENMVVTATTDGFYKAKVTPTNAISGEITILCPEPIVPGVINVMVFDGKSYVAVALINVKKNPVSRTIAGTYSITEHGVFSVAPAFDAGQIKGNKFTFTSKDWDFNSSLKKNKDNILTITSTGTTPDGFDKGTANYAPGADGGYWDYKFLAGKVRHTADAQDCTPFYGFLPHGESEYVYNHKNMTVTFTQGENIVVVDYFPAGKHIFSKDITDGGVTQTKVVELDVPSMGLNFQLPAVYREQFNQFMLYEGSLKWKDADWLLYWAESCYITFTKQ